MSNSWRAAREQSQSEPDEEVRRPSLAFVTRILLVLLLVALFLFLFKRSNRLEPRLQAVLDAEEEAYQAGDWGALAVLLDPDHDPFRQQQRAQFDAMMSARRRGESYAGSPYPLTVVQASRRDDRAWARVSGEALAGEPFYRVEFFRQVYGSWLHTGPDPAWWGAEREQHTAHLVWHYREADEPWIARVATPLETAHAQVCADLGLDPRRSVVTFDLCYSVDCASLPPYPTGPSIDLPAPLLAGWSEETVIELLPGIMVGNLLARATNLPPAQSVPAGGGLALMEGIRWWETGQVTGAPLAEAWRTELRAAAAAGSFLSFDQMSDPATPEIYPLVYAQSYALVEYLVSTQGPGLLPALASASPPPHSLREALEEVLGPGADLAAIEQGWMAWMGQRYGQ